MSTTDLIVAAASLDTAIVKLTEASNALAKAAGAENVNDGDEAVVVTGNADQGEVAADAAAREIDRMESWKRSPESNGSNGDAPKMPYNFKIGGGKKKKKRRGGKSQRAWKKNKKGGRQSKKRR
jgi:hypothetical protein